LLPAPQRPEANVWTLNRKMDGQTTKRHPDAHCAFIARRQYGVIARRQALDTGMTPAMIEHRLDARRWETLYPSTYRFAGAPPSPQQNAMAVCLWGGDGTCLAGRSAAAGWGLEGGTWSPPTIICPRRIRASADKVRVRRSTTLRAEEVTRLGPLPITDVARTLIDLASDVDQTTLEVALDQALRSEKVTVPRLHARLARLSGSRLPGLSALASLVADRDPHSAYQATELETMVRRWLKRFGFPDPVFQFWVSLPDHGPARLDFAYPDLAIGIEADSYVWHSGRDAFERDRARISEFASLGWIIIQTTYREVKHHPERPAKRLRGAFRQRLDV
jgi:hypothetical protein